MQGDLQRTDNHPATNHRCMKYTLRPPQILSLPINNTITQKKATLNKESGFLANDQQIALLALVIA